MSSLAPVANNQLSVAILVGAAIGDNIMAARFIRDFKVAFDTVVFDIYAPNVNQSRWICANLPGIRDQFQDSLFGQMTGNYDASLFYGDTISLVAPTVSVSADAPSPLDPVFERMRSFGAEELSGTESGHRKECIRSCDLMYKHNQTRATASQFLAGIEYGGARFPLEADDHFPAKQMLSRKQYISVHNGFDVSQVTAGGGATKAYRHFDRVISLIKEQRADLFFVQLGASTSVEIAGTDLNLVGKTNLRQATSIIKDAACHLDNERGLVTIASCFGTPCVVVYGPSSADYFAYTGNVAVRPIECGGCWWTSDDWIVRCPRGMSDPVCMDKQPPEAIAHAVLRLIERLGI